MFFRDFLSRDIIDAFETPSKRAKPTEVPLNDDFQLFYSALANPMYKTAFLFAATSGLRLSGLCQLAIDDVDEDKRMVVPDKESSTKEIWPTFYNHEAAEAFEQFREECDPGDDRVFQTTKQPLNRKFRHVSEGFSLKVTVQRPRRWFATAVSRCGVDAKYIHTFCGRTLSSVLEKHYLDYSPDRLNEIYDEAGLTVLK